MQLAPLARAVEVLMSPLAWESRDGWLAESLRRIRDVGGTGAELPADVLTGLEASLGLPGDEPGWLGRALDGECRGSPLPAPAEIPEALLAVVSLRCALAAGLATLHRLAAGRSALGQAFDRMGTGMAIFGRDGVGEVARNARLFELLEEEPERDGLLGLIARQARQAAAEGGRPRDYDGERELGDRCYRLLASRVAAGALLAEPAVLVLVDRLSFALPTTQELRVSFGLRGREPQVALLAAEGLSNAAIAARLRLSAHTVRHYLERVLDRLGLRTRKALALRLIAGGEGRPQPPDRRGA